MTAGLYLTKIRNVYAGIAPLEPKRIDRTQFGSFPKGDIMRILGNIIWILFGGLISALGWLITGCLFCITIIGIPFGKQFFKIAKLALMPFGATVERVNYL